VLVDQLTPEEEAYFQRFDAAWKSYFDQSPDVWLKFLVPGDNTKNSIKSIDSLAHAELQLSRRLMIHAHMLIEVKHYTKVHLDVNKLRAYMESAIWAITFMSITKFQAVARRTLQPQHIFITTTHHRSGLRRGCRSLNNEASLTSSLSALHLLTFPTTIFIFTLLYRYLLIIKKVAK